MKVSFEFEGISEEERVNAGKTCDELQKAGFMLMQTCQVWIPMQFWKLGSMAPDKEHSHFAFHFND